jgi:nitrogen fixation protein FixH
MLRAFTTGPFTGRHFSVIIVAFFAVVVGVNLVMARAASSTFGGVVVENSYVASQKYNTWLAEAAREKALGWSAAAKRTADGRVAVTLAGVPAGVVTLTGEARHPLGRLPDTALAFTRAADGSWISAAPLAGPRWQLRLTVEASGQTWRTALDLK